MGFYIKKIYEECFNKKKEMNKEIDELLAAFSILGVIDTPQRGMVSSVISEPRYRSPEDLRSAATFLLGHHTRVGMASPLTAVPPDVLEKIASGACPFGAARRANVVHPLVMSYDRTCPLGDILDFQFPTYPGLRRAFSKRMASICKSFPSIPPTKTKKNLTVYTISASKHLYTTQ
jgi:hypothetical protein